MKNDLPLTPHPEDWEKRIKLTFDGMASWGGAIKDKTCFDCQFYIKHKRNPAGYGSCQKARDMGVKSNKTIPKIALACKFFQKKELPPIIPQKPLQLNF